MIGNATTDIVSGNQYVIAFCSTVGTFAMQHGDTASVTPYTMTEHIGDQAPDSIIWTVEQSGSGYTISTQVNGTKKYLARTNKFVNVGYSITLQDTPFVWSFQKINSKNRIRVSDTKYRATYYLRYYNANRGWIASSTAGTLAFYTIE